MLGASEGGFLLVFGRLSAAAGGGGQNGRALMDNVVAG